jgi:MFS family permease
MSSKSYAFFLSITAALGGFLFGFDTAVISGAERAIQEIWKLSDLTHGLAIASALYGTVLGALFGGIPADKFGRKKSLLWIGLFYLVSAIGSGMAWDVESFIFFRFIGGLGVGASSVVAPMYISEIAPARNRGLLVALYQFNIVFGILVAYLSNYFLAYNVVILTNSFELNFHIQHINLFLTPQYIYLNFLIFLVLFVIFFQIINK